MTEITDLNHYRNKAYLELCLDLVQDAYDSLQEGHYDLVEAQLHTVLDTFDREELLQESSVYRVDPAFFMNNKKIK